MNRKTIIQLVIIVVMFSGSAVVIYFGFFANKPKAPANISLSLPTTLPSMGTAIPASNGTVSGNFPYGDKFDFGVFKKQGLKYDFEDITVKAPDDIGKDQSVLIKGE